MNKTKRIEIFSRWRDANPEPTTELAYASTFELLIAVMLSAQATDVSVNKATEKLFPVANTPEAIHALGLKKLKGYIKTIGLFNSKAENIIKTCRILIDQYQSEVPDSREALEVAPGSRKKDSQRRPQYGIPADCHGGRHTYFQSVEPHRDRSGQNGSGG